MASIRKIFFQIVEFIMIHCFNNPSKLINRNRELSKNLTQPFVKLMYSSLVLGLFLNFTLPFFDQLTL